MVNPTSTIHSLTRFTPAKPTGKLRWIDAGNAIVVSMIDNQVINLCDKTLSKLMHCLFDILTKLYNFEVNML